MFEEQLAFRFTKEEGDECGSVNDHLGNLARNAVFAVTEDFVFRARILTRKRVHPPKQVLNLAGHNVAFAPTFEPLPAFFERFLNGFGERLAGFAGNLASQVFRGFILDEQGHVYSRIYLIDLLYTIRQAARMRTKSFPDR